MDKFGRRDTAVYFKSEELFAAEHPDLAPVAGDAVTLDAGIAELPADRPVVITGSKPTGEEITEVARLRRTEVDNGRTKLVFTKSLEHAYERTSCRMYANAAPASHGETATEILGSGDGSQARQRFVLKQPPLTWLSSSQPGGVESSLEVRVNDIKWHEVPYLYGHGPDERVYVTRRRDDGTTVVEFGDGITGARLPTGQENITATYRKGIGLVGRMKAGQLSLLMTRPLGLKAVTNPLAVMDGDDPEGLDSARRNAPLKVLTLDRLVSLKDYEDFARSFAGIAKAQATWTCTGRRRVIAVTVAGPDGAQIRPDAPTQDLYRNLRDALESFGDPFVPVTLATYRPALFRITGKVKRNPDFTWERVLAGLKDALKAGFSYEARDLGQPVALSEVVAALQAVPGVVGIDIDDFHRIPESPGLTTQFLLRAAPPEPDPAAPGVILGAELLTVDLKEFNLVEMIEGAP
jgi:predicted phage baseplate assembly protein